MRFSLRSKLIGGLVLLFVWLVAVESVNIYASRAIEKRLASTVELDVKSADILAEVSRKTELVHMNTLLLLTANSLEEMKQLAAEIAKVGGEISTLLDTLQNTCQSRAEFDKLAEFRFAWDTYSRLIDEQVLPANNTSRKVELLALLSENGAVGTAARTALEKLEEFQQANITAARHRLELANQNRRRSQNILLFMILLAIIPSLAFGAYLSSQVADAMSLVSSAAQLVSAGDFDWRVTVQTGDEIESVAESLNRMVRHLKKTLAARRETAEQLQWEINERKRIEKMLAAEEQRCAAILRLIGDGVIITDLEGRLVLVNKIAEKLTGWTQEQASGKPLDQVFHLIDAATGKPCQDTLEKALQADKMISLANRVLLVARDETVRVITYSGAPISNQDGEPIGVVLVFHDITETAKSEPI